MSRDRATDQHRAVVEKRLNRKLGPDEIVDHADTNKANNASANLSVKGRSEHSREHTDPGRRSLARLTKALSMPERKEKLY